MATNKNRLTLSVDEAAEMLGIGRSLAYEMVRAGRIPTIRMGAKWLISRAALEDMINHAGQAVSPEGVASVP